MASEQQTRQEIEELFGSAVAEHQDVAAECLSILRMYNLTPQTLFFKYEAFLLSRPSGLRAKLSIMNVDTFRELKKEIQREQQTARLAAAAGVQSTPAHATPKTSVRKSMAGMNDIGGFLDNLSTPSRPSSSKARPLSSSTPQTQPTAIPQRLGVSSFSTPKRSTPGSSYEDTTPLARNPVMGSSPLVDSPMTEAPPFSARQRATKPVMTLNSELGNAYQGVPIGSKQRTSLNATSDTKAYAYRYMFEKISARSEALDDVIDDFAENLREAYQIPELGDPHYVSEHPIYTVGRILTLPTDSSKPTAQSMLLESSRALGSGKRIPIRFAENGALKVRGGAPGVKGFGCWSGAIVGVKGRNGGGGAFVVEEVLQPPPAPLALTSVDELLDNQYGHKLDGAPLGIMVAAGPFTLESDLLYEPLEALAEAAIAKKPDVLILLGPFVDSMHPLLRIGAVNETPNEIFRNEVSTRLAKVVEACPGTVIMLAPSVRDMVSRHLAFPQGALEREGLGLPKKVKLLPNPCIFSINEVVIGLSSVDVLFHLRKEEYFQKAEEAVPEPGGERRPDVMAGLCRHVLGQRSFYPIFPSPEAHAAEVNLDVTHERLLRIEGAAPDILILPSKLQHFVKVVDSTVVINPAHLSKARSAGTFANLTVFPLPRDELETPMEGDDEGREHRIYERVRCDIERI